jgi:hypothetical protein
MKVIYDDGSIRVSSPDFAEPVPPLDTGDVCEVLIPFKTLGNEIYQFGDKLEILGKTNATPHNRKTSIGNLLVRGKNGNTTVWTNIEWAIAQGILRRIR